MQKIIYNIHSKTQLIIGYTEETGVRSVEFTGFTKDISTSTVYLMVDGIGLYPLVDFTFPVSYTYTVSQKTYEAYLVEKTADNSFIKKSPNFDIVVKHSAKIGSVVTPVLPQFTEWFTPMSELYQTVKTTYESGGFKGAKGDDGYSPTVTTSKVGKVTTVTITDKNGTHTATINDGSNGNDGTSPTVSVVKSGKVTTITITDKDGTHTATINDGADGSDLTAQAITTALGYTPANSTALNDKVDKVDGKGLSTNDYDNTSKAKVDAVPANPKYTDTVYDDTEIKEDIEQLNDDLANYNNTKVGYSEVENGQLKMYSDSTKAHLLATLDLPTTDLTDYVKNTDYATSTKAGVIRQSNGLMITNSGEAKSNAINNTTYTSVNSNYFIGKGTLENIKTDLVGRALADDTQPAWDSGTLNKALARLNAEKAKGEWVLKGTMTSTNMLNVDLSGCTELVIYADCVGTAGTNLNTILNDTQVTLCSPIVNGNRSSYCKFADGAFGIEPIISKYGTSLSTISSNAGGMFIKDYKISDLTRFRFGNNSAVTSCNIEFWAR